MKTGSSKIWKLLISAACTALLAGTAGCSLAGPLADELNPYGEGNAVETLGTRDSTAIGSASGGGGKEAEKARHALEVMGSYKRAQAPQPVYPVVQPAEVRLMWVPDHLNRHGDLVPAHYYYLRVLHDRWGVTDAFEYEQQLSDGSGQGYVPAAGGATPSYGSGGGGGGSTPWVYKEEK